MKDFLVNDLVKSAFNRHRPGHEPNVFLFGTPRGGTSWLMEMIWSQPGFKPCDEPLDLRNPLVRKHLGIREWTELYDEGSKRRLESYFRRFHEGRLHIVEPLPGRGRYHRVGSSRIVFKIIHGAEDRASWLAERFNGRVLLLLRHPIPVSLSRKQLPRLEAFLASDYRRHFSAPEIERARQVMHTGSPLERGVLDWCLQTAVPLRQAREDWLIVTYEQLVLEPEAVLPVLAERLELPEPERMEQHLTQASKVTNQSDDETRKLLDQGGQREARRKLVEKWRSRVDSAEEERAMRLLETFGIDVYRSGETLPRRHLHAAPKQRGGADGDPSPRLPAGAA